MIPIIDSIASLFQVVMAICICVFINKNETKYENKKRLNILMISSILSYYLGIVNILVILGICVFPCLAFIFYEIKYVNYIALIPTIIFTVLHIIHELINFM